jgi:hypothetical protein
MKMGKKTENFYEKIGGKCKSERNSRKKKESKRVKSMQNSERYTGRQRRCVRTKYAFIA